MAKQTRKKGLAFTKVNLQRNTAAPSDMPREGFSRSVEPAGDALRSWFPGPKHLSLLEVDFKMRLHRDLVRGTGFYDTRLPPNTARTLPMVNLLGADKDHIQALIQEGLPDD
ncbi:hypothetical protein CEP54_014153 [Fusarium duplospermum]|uniref:Uncharacterized protein n=1 Tax=Fusarium duplospermum TaxID=1325734 RepID=A0A428NYA3_9HYPO|nr:hypothetical protein CEP54_014153 [Fusarium duplospermum]